MDKEYFESFMNGMKQELLKKIDETAERLNSKLEKNMTDIRALEHTQSEQESKLENLTTRSEQNTEDVNDIKMRLDKLEKEKSLNDQKFSSIEQVIDDKVNDKTPPKLKRLIQDVSKMKESINNDNEKRDDEDNKLRKLSYSQIITKQQDQSNIPTQLHVQEDKYYDDRGKVGISPITIDDIRQFSQDKEATDEDLV